jgi:hypothetical protein
MAQKAQKYGEVQGYCISLEEPCSLDETSGYKLPEK